MSAELALLPGYLAAHLQLTLVALGLAVLVSVPAGVLATRRPWIERPALAVAGVIQTVPALALLAIAVPILAALGFQSIGFLPALVGLTLYGVLPILRNTVTGIAAVDPAVVEAAQGVGMTPLQQLRRVELPLAMPVIVAGIRTAAVWTVGMATLSTPVGATSLGNYIFSGLQTRNADAVLIGCVSAAALALLLDGIIHAVEVASRRRQRRRMVAALGVLAVLVVYAAAPVVRGAATPATRPFVIGAKTFTEQYILGDILAGAVEQRTGRPAKVLSSLGSTVAFDALRDGRIDAYVEYSGTIWTTVLHRTEIPTDRGAMQNEVARVLADR
ncbi:MAG TPA: ABC transporter permease/substrate-binding protein, partial [Vicinamibacterales bacterium]